jgi:hypothetical protein
VGTRSICPRTVASHQIDEETTILIMMITAMCEVHSNCARHPPTFYLQQIIDRTDAISVSHRYTTSSLDESNEMNVSTASRRG